MSIHSFTLFYSINLMFNQIHTSTWSPSINCFQWPICLNRLIVNLIYNSDGYLSRRLYSFTSLISLNGDMHTNTALFSRTLVNGLEKGSTNFLLRIAVSVVLIFLVQYTKLQHILEIWRGRRDGWSRRWCGCTSLCLFHNKSCLRKVIPASVPKNWVGSSQPAIIRTNAEPV